MYERQVITRKNHPCAVCGDVIKKGSLAKHKELLIGGKKYIHVRPVCDFEFLMKKTQEFLERSQIEMMKKRSVLTPDEAADYLRLSRITIMKKYRAGKIKGHRRGHRTVRFYRDDLDLYLQG